MEKTSFRNFGFLTVNGLIAILFGILLLAFTRGFIETVVFYFGLLVLVGGVIMLIPAARNIIRNRKPAWPMIQSVLTIAIGLIIMIFPKNSLGFFIVVIGVWAILSGILELFILINSGKNLKNRNVFLIGSLLTIVLGVVLILNPLDFAGFLVKLIGIFSVLFGILMIWLAFAAREAVKNTVDTGNS